MRISDWSSDVCSSDLPVIRDHLLDRRGRWRDIPGHQECRPTTDEQDQQYQEHGCETHGRGPRSGERYGAAGALRARKSVGEGKSVYVRVTIGVSRITTKKKSKNMKKDTNSKKT